MSDGVDSRAPFPAAVAREACTRDWSSVVVSGQCLGLWFGGKVVNDPAGVRTVWLFHDALIVIEAPREVSIQEARIRIRTGKQGSRFSAHVLEPFRRHPRRMGRRKKEGGGKGTLKLPKYGVPSMKRTLVLSFKYESSPHSLYPSLPLQPPDM